MDVNSTDCRMKHRSYTATATVPILLAVRAIFSNDQSILRVCMRVCPDRLPAARVSFSQLVQWTVGVFCASFAGLTLNLTLIQPASTMSELTFELV